jgi:NAD(P)-dependent dehydrogenase (short-subunit alcohol dehydrogenase family)
MSAKQGRLTGKVVIVTGASSGIGKAAALRFAQEGAAVVMAARTPNTLADAREEVAGQSNSDHVIALPTDVALEPHVDALIRTTIDHYGQLDGIFNAAGISGRRFGDGPADACTLEGWNTVLSANLTSIFLCTKHALTAMLPRKTGSIVNLASVLGIVGGDESFATHAYAASKGGIISFTRSVSSYYAPQGIRANVVAPSLIRTNMSKRAQDDASIIEKLPRLQPLTGDFGSPEDVAAAALYLLSDDAAFVTGVVLPIDGGWTVR